MWQNSEILLDVSAKLFYADSSCKSNFKCNWFD